MQITKIGKTSDWTFECPVTANLGIAHIISLYYVQINLPCLGLEPQVCLIVVHVSKLNLRACPQGRFNQY